MTHLPTISWAAINIAAILWEKRGGYNLTKVKTFTPQVQLNQYFLKISSK
jgi:hypothetical protein